MPSLVRFDTLNIDSMDGFFQDRLILNMRLNTLSPPNKSKKKPKRVGRGIGSGSGKTCGRGHKGLKARSGGKVAPGFEGGQMPLVKRLPKYGFSSRVSRVAAEVRLKELNKVEGELVNLETLKAAKIIGKHIKKVKIFLSGSLDKKVMVEQLAVSKGAKKAIETAGGSIG